MSDQIAELITVIKESEVQTRKELQELHLSVQTMADNFSQYWAHKAVYDEDKKHDDKFKQEVREHIKAAAPLLEYVKEQKNTVSKMKIAFFVAVMFAILAGLGFSLK